MAFLSKLYGKQVNKAANLAAHKAVGATLTFDSYTDFPQATDLAKEKCLCGYLSTTNEETSENTLNGIPEYFDYRDTSTRNLYVDASSNMIYRWKHYTLDEWGAAHWDYDEEKHEWIVPEEPGVEPKREDYPTEELYEIAHDNWQELVDLQYPNNPEIGSQGWCYVTCAGGGSVLYWNKI